MYSLTCPYYRYFYNMDTSLLRTVRLVPEIPKIIHLPVKKLKADTWFSPCGVRIKEV